MEQRLSPVSAAAKIRVEVFGKIPSSVCLSVHQTILIQSVRCPNDGATRKLKTCCFVVTLITAVLLLLLPHPLVSIMSAAAARRRKQLQARQKEPQEDAVGVRLEALLNESEDEAVAYEALQLAQSQVRKMEHAGDYKGATDLAYSSSLTLLKHGRVSVASQLLQVLAQVLRECHVKETQEWVNRIVELHEVYENAIGDSTGLEVNRLQRLERDFLRRCVLWSSDLGTTRFGDLRLHELLGQQCWLLSKLDHSGDSDAEDIENLQCDAVSHMALAEKPDTLLEWFKTLPKPTAAQIKLGHTCPPSDRDSLLTRSLLVFCTIENLRDANILLRAYINDVEERDINDLTASYMNKDDGMAPSHVVFGSMLLRTCEKDKRTGPLYQWLLRSFKRELDMLYKPQIIQSYTTKIGKVYFDIQPPPSMLSMVSLL